MSPEPPVLASSAASSCGADTCVPFRVPAGGPPGAVDPPGRLRRQPAHHRHRAAGRAEAARQPHAQRCPGVPTPSRPTASLCPPSLDSPRVVLLLLAGLLAARHLPHLQRHHRHLHLPAPLRCVRIPSSLFPPSSPSSSPSPCLPLLITLLPLPPPPLTRLPAP